MFPPSSPDFPIRFFTHSLVVLAPHNTTLSGHSILLAPLYYSFKILDTLTYYNPYISNNTPHYPFIRLLGSIPGQDLGLTGSFTTRLFPLSNSTPFLIHIPPSLGTVFNPWLKHLLPHLITHHHHHHKPSPTLIYKIFLGPQPS